MKKLFLFLILGISLNVNAQINTVQIVVLVLDQNGAPVSNATCAIDVYHNGTTSTSSLLSDNNGYIVDTVFINGQPPATVLVTAYNATCLDSTGFYYSSPGWYSFQDTLTLCNTATPNCNYTVNHSATPTGAFYFSHTGSGGALSTYSWDFGDGNTSSLSNPTHAYSQPGTYTYCLSIDSCPPVCGTVTIASSSCDANFTTTINGLSVNIFPAAAGTAGVFEVYWGDGLADTIPSTQVTPNGLSHTYAQAGTYSMFLVHYNGNCYKIEYDTLVISTGSTGNCDASFYIDSVPNALGNIVIWNTSTPAYNANGNVQYSWDFGDGNTSSQAFPQHTYSGAGTYMICLTITETTVAGFCSDTHCDTLTIDSLGNIVFKTNGSFTIQVQDVNAFGQEELSFTNIQMYPNPVRDFVGITFSSETEKEVFITLINVSGQEILNSNAISNIGANRLQVDCSSLESGIYLLQLSDGVNRVQEKLIVQ